MAPIFFDIAESAQHHQPIAEGIMPQDKASVQAQVAALGSFSKTFAKKEIDLLPEVLDESERLLAITSGMYENATCLIVVTNRRLMFLHRGLLGGKKQIEVPLSQIGSVSQKTGLMFGKVSVSCVGSSKEITQIEKKDVSRVAAAISAGLTATREARPTAEAPRPMVRIPEDAPVSGDSSTTGVTSPVPQGVPPVIEHQQSRAPQNSYSPPGSLAGVKVSLSREGRLRDTETGRLSFEGSRLSLKKLIRRKDILDLQSINGLEHRGRKLVIRLPGTFFVVDFVGKKKDQALALKEEFARVVGLGISGDPNGFHLELVHVVAAAIVAVIVVVAVAGGGLGGHSGLKSDGGGSSTSSSSVASTPGAMPTADVPGLPEYSILDEEVSDAPIKTQVSMKVLVSGSVTKPGVTALLQSLFRNTLKREGFQYHSNPTSVYIYAYTDRERAASGAEWIGMISKCHSCDEPVLDLKEQQFKNIGKAPEEKFGLSEEKRKDVFRELVMIEDRAGKEAEARYPTDPTQALRPGDSFTVTRRTPLAPKLDVDPMVGLKTLVQLPPGTKLHVKEVREQGGFTKYYRVEAKQPGGRRHSGWVMLTALMGQAEVDVMAQTRKQAELMEQIQEAEKAALAKKHGLNEDQLSAITVEAFEKDWPMPTPVD